MSHDVLAPVATPIPAVAARSLSVILGHQTVLDDVSFQIDAGTFTGIVGPNGAGKTTLLRVLMGLVKNYSGDIEVFGHPPHQLGPKGHAIGYVPQRPHFDRRFPATVLDVVMMGRVACRGLFRRLNQKDRRAALDSLERVGAADLRDRPIGELSGGQQQRVFLARAMCSHTRLLLLDEPNTGLDPSALLHFFDLLKDLQKQDNLAVIVVSHDLDLISRYSDTLICINKTLHVHGSPGDVLSSPAMDHLYAECAFERRLSAVDRRDTH